MFEELAGKVVSNGEWIKVIADDRVTTTVHDTLPTVKVWLSYLTGGTYNFFALKSVRVDDLNIVSIVVPGKRDAVKVVKGQTPESLANVLGLRSHQFYMSWEDCEATMWQDTLDNELVSFAMDFEWREHPTVWREEHGIYMDCWVNEAKDEYVVFIGEHNGYLIYMSYHTSPDSPYLYMSDPEDDFYAI